MSLPLFSFRNISLSFGQDLLFDDITAQVSARDKVCLVGRNGSGKSTLLKIMAGEIEADKGEWLYVSEDNPFTIYSSPLLFNNKEQAEEEAAKWNTGVVVEREGAVRSFDKSEKSQSKLRAYLNREQW